MKKPKVKDAAFTATAMVYLHQTVRFQSYPFRFLLYNNWIVIIICFSLTCIELLKENQLSIQSILIPIILFMVTLLPDSKPLHNASYIAIESALIFYSTTLGNLPLLSTLYVIVIIQSCFLFNLLGRWIVAGLSFLLFLGHQVYDALSTFRVLEPHQQQVFGAHLIAETFVFGLALLFAVQLVSTLLTQIKVKKQLVVAHQQLQQYKILVETLAVVKDRIHMAHTVHDALGHTLMAQNIQLQTAVKLWQHDPDKAKPFLEQAQQLAVDAIQEIRRSIRAFQVDVQEERLLEMTEPPVKDLSQDMNVFLT